jgi:hypothetical protein
MTDLREQGICMQSGEPHAKQFECVDWRSVNSHGVLCEVEAQLGFWVNGRFYPVNLGPLSTLIEESKKSSADYQRLVEENQVLKFAVQHERELTKNAEKCLQDALNRYHDYVSGKI